jgi:hypothetical protein
MDLFRVDEPLLDVSKEDCHVGMDMAQYDEYMKDSRHLIAEEGHELMLMSNNNVDFKPIFIEIL